MSHVSTIVWDELQQKIYGLTTSSIQKDPEQLQLIANTLQLCAENKISRDDAEKINALTALFVGKIQKEAPASTSHEQLITTLQPLLEMQLFPIPKDMLRETFKFFSVCDLLKIRLLNHAFKKIIDEDPVLQIRISHYLFEHPPVLANIPTEELKSYVKDEKLYVEINQALCLWKINEHLAQGLPWITHLIVKNAPMSELTKLFETLKQSTQISSLYLFDCEFNQTCIESLNALRVSKTLSLRFCNPILSDCEFPPEYGKSYFIEEGSAFTIESFLGEQPEELAILELKISSDEVSAEEIVECTKILKPWILSPIITSIWFSTLTGTDFSPPSKEKMHRDGFAFIQNNPHHGCLLAAIKSAQH